MPRLRASERAALRAKPWDSTSARLPRAKKAELVKTPWLSPMIALTIAAVDIQRMTRGHQVRRLGIKNYPPKKKPPPPSRPQLDKYLRAMRGSREKADDGFSSWCAVRMQAWWRMVEEQRLYYLIRFSLYQIAALQVQGAWREFCQRRYMQMPTKAQATPEETAARIIQSLWRRYTNVRIFRYYRDLIRFRLTGDPVMLLRTINPSETALLDRASGVHVRFRLGGSSFPPTMMYKIFVHRPICDVNAFAPRDYTTSRPRTPRQRHNKDEFIEEARDKAVRVGSIRVGVSYFGAEVKDVGPDGTSNWYRRVENNEWRPITMRVLADVEPLPPGLSALSPRAEPVDRSKLFHWCRTTRQETVVQRRKQRKRAWLKRMYLEGMAKDDDQIRAIERLKEDDARGRRSLKEPAESKGGFMDVVEAAIEKERKEAERKARIPAPKEFDWDDEDEALSAEQLLQWSSELDYDGYISNWMAIATSGPSGGMVPESAADAKRSIRGPGSAYK